jgi:hypothetical protein
MSRRRRGGRAGFLRGRNGNLVPALLAGGGIIVGGRLLTGTYTLFQHAYLGSYWAVAGVQVTSAYWGSVRFAFEQTVLVAVGVGVVGSLAAVELAKAVSR